MAKITNLRERVHQPFRDALIRTSGYFASALTDTTDLFTQSGRGEALSNLKTGSVLPSDQSMVILALRCFLWFRQSIQRIPTVIAATTDTNGDYAITGANNAAALALMNGSAPGRTQDVHRLYWQASEQLLWDFGAGEKISLRSMPSTYFPWGGGLHGDLGGSTDIILWNNGTPDHAGILRIGRAVVLPSRQEISCKAKMFALGVGNNAAVFSSTQGARNMMSLVDNLNAVDLVQKVIAFCFDGLFSRDVQ
jgi:hypothetical protein